MITETAAAGSCGTGTHMLDGEFEATVSPLAPRHDGRGGIQSPGPVWRVCPWG